MINEQMSSIRTASRYALALLGVAVERNELEAVGRDVDYLERMISRVPEFAQFLRSPVINKEKKKRALRELLAGKTGDTVAAFVLLLASKDRESLLAEIVRQFHRLRDEQLGVLNVTARSAAAFSPEQAKTLGDRIGKSTGEDGATEGRAGPRPHRRIHGPVRGHRLGRERPAAARTPQGTPRRRGLTAARTRGA